jgi:hypothetical protein
LRQLRVFRSAVRQSNRQHPGAARGVEQRPRLFGIGQVRQAAQVEDQRRALEQIWRRGDAQGEFGAVRADRPRAGHAGNTDRQT